MKRAIFLITAFTAGACFAGIMFPGVEKEVDPYALPKVEAIIDGTQPLDALILDRKIESWSDIGLTYEDAVRLNNEAVIANGTAWDGWVTDGDLLPDGSIFLVPGRYLQSPVQTNGIARFNIDASSHMNATSYRVAISTPLGEFPYPYYGTDGVVCITAGGSLPGATPGLIVLSAQIVGYENAAEAGRSKSVANLKVVDDPSMPRDLTPKEYVDGKAATAREYADQQIAAYANDDTKIVRGSQIRLNNTWSMSEFGRLKFLSAETEGSAEMEGDGNYFAIAQNYYPLLSFQSDIAGLKLNDVNFDVADEQATITLFISTNGVTSEPFAEWAESLRIGSWVRIMDYSINTYPAVSNGSYVLQFTVNDYAEAAFFRAMQLNGESVVTVHTDILKVVGRIEFTNGWSIQCTTNGLEFIQP
ncbi:MAG: hypothetical protein WC959_05480 [Kiritimatiellales bacterium]